MRCAVHLATFCGLRRGEIFGLKCADVDLDARVVHVRHSLTNKGETKGPKTKAGIRDIPIPAHLALMLRAHRTEFGRANSDEMFFTNSRAGAGRISMTGWFYGTWKDLLRRAGLWKPGEELYHFHALRHFAGSWMIENGLAPPDVAGLMGHETFDLTLQVYAHSVFGDDHRQKAVENMSARLIGIIVPEPQSAEDGATA
jgi:integrase